MQGILIVDKPMDWTSFDVVAKLRGVLGTRKLGHSGTLDPMATGVLPVFCGGASKAVDLQLDHDKAYRAVLRLGQRTDTGDITGTVLETAPVTAGELELRAVLPQFVGKQMQVPPMYSAVKVGLTLRQQPGGSYRISVRTAKGVDACAIARRLGGGGHTRAAGCELLGDLENAKNAILAEVEAELDAPQEEA